MEIHRTSFKVAFKIQSRPGGGYIAQSADPPITLEADSREEIEAKVRAKITEITGAKIGPGISIGDSSIQAQVSKTTAVSLGSAKSSPGSPQQYDLSIIRTTSPGFFSGTNGLVRLGVGILIGGFAVFLWMQLTSR